MTETMLVLQNITLIALTIVVTLNTVTIAKALNTPPPCRGGSGNSLSGWGLAMSRPFSIETLEEEI